MTGSALRGFISGLTVLAGLAGWSRAAPVTWVFEGQVRMIEVTSPVFPGSLEPLKARLTSLGVLVGAPVSGLVRFESSTADIRPESDNADYLNAMIQSEVTIATYALRSDLFPGDPDLVFSDIYAATSPDLEPYSMFFTQQDLGDEIGLASRFGLMGLELSSHDPAFFTGATQSLPLNPPSLLDVDPFGYDTTSAFGYGSQIFVGVGAELGLFTVQAAITRLERVPEPPIEALLVPAALALAALRRRAW